MSEPTFDEMIDALIEVMDKMQEQMAMTNEEPSKQEKEDESYMQKERGT